MLFKNALIYGADFRFHPGWLTVEGGRFAAVGAGEAGAGGTDLAGARIIPGLVDIHTHGNSGADFSDGSDEGLRRMVDFKVDPEKKPWAVTGWKPGDDPAKRAEINSIYIDTESLSVHNAELQKVYKAVIANEQEWEYYNLEGAEYIITAFGTVARIAKSAIDVLKAEGINVGLVRPITVWPFPYDAVAKAVAAPGVKAVLDVELNEGQMLEDVKLAVNGSKPVDFFGHLGSQMPTTDEIVAKVHSMTAPPLRWRASPAVWAMISATGH